MPKTHVALLLFFFAGSCWNLTIFAAAVDVTPNETATRATGEATTSRSSPSPFNLRSGEKTKQEQQQQQQQQQIQAATRILQIRANEGKEERDAADPFLECTLYLLDTEYMEGETIHSKDQWCCEFDEAFARDRLGVADPFYRLEGLSEEDLLRSVAPDPGEGAAKSPSLESGAFLLRFRTGRIDRKAGTLEVAPSSITGLAARDVATAGHRGLSTSPSAAGHRRTLVVRITSHDGSLQPMVSSMDIRRAVFGQEEASEINLGSPDHDADEQGTPVLSTRIQFERCSYRQMTLEPFDGTTLGDFRYGIRPMEIANGVVDLALTEEQSLELADTDPDTGYSTIKPNIIMRYSREVAAAKLGNLRQQFDHVLYCLPETVTGFLATAIINRYNSWYTGDLCTSLPVTMHEIGHNLGLEHAGFKEIYDDTTGYMGYSSFEDTVKCFNPANSYKLGWYDKQTVSVDPIRLSDGYHRFLLRGIVDYEPGEPIEPEKAGTSSNTDYGIGEAPVTIPGSGDRDGREDSPVVVLRLQTKGAQGDYYVGYNRRVGMNEGTEGWPDAVLVVQKLGSAMGAAQTKLKAALRSPGDAYAIQGHNGKAGRPLYIRWESLSADGRDAVVVLSTTETRAPSVAPTALPGPGGDDESFRYKWDPSLDCGWVARNPDKRCSYRWKGKAVSGHWCPAACSGVATGPGSSGHCRKGGDDPSFSFNGFGKAVVKDCEWVRAKPKKRCSKQYTKNKNKNKIQTAFKYCPDSCRLC